MAGTMPWGREAAIQAAARDKKPMLHDLSTAQLTGLVTEGEQARLSPNPDSALLVVRGEAARLLREERQRQKVEPTC